MPLLSTNATGYGSRATTYHRDMPSHTSPITGLFSLALVLLATAGCDALTRTHFERVGVTGLARCPQGSMLNRPIAVLVESSSGGTSVQSYFTGTGLRESIDLPVGRREWTVRFGLCQQGTDPASSSYSCGGVDWYGTRTYTFDPATAGTAIPALTPPETGCWAAAETAPPS